MSALGNSICVWESFEFTAFNPFFLYFPNEFKKKYLLYLLKPSLLHTKLLENKLGPRGFASVLK